MPLTTLMYLAAYLDRGNLGNAKNQGLVEDIIGDGMFDFVDIALLR
jgi:hypothetical protein